MITVVGVGADGRDGLPADSRRAVEAVEVLMGAPRQLDLVPASAAERVAWPSPLLPALPGAERPARRRPGQAVGATGLTRRRVHRMAGRDAGDRVVGHQEG
ncbi:hypothetical protein [Nonomuraea ferruginea]|uniref:Cobalamin biosynthesis bifunctional protein CbiET n=1 Tax=Nonomuraea ferruginea TaxID=46174 RepID=A0ABT4T594_9ACTN|nr:hypothetical protein [Nonomuraea ferruginea]MDA0644662.1 hypothetical protein [Nonomuraea ferruginea]